jgi:serine/threonine-protein kinase
VRIAVALIKSRDGANVWSETYDRELKDIFAVQSEIAGAVAKELKVALLGTNGQSAQLTTTATPSNQNVEAYNALLQGNFYENRRTVADTRKAIGYYEEAIRLDPRYALAYAKLSLTVGNLANAFGDLSMKQREEANARARVLAQKALALDPNLAEAHRAQGGTLSDGFNSVEAEAEFRRALELAPQDPSVTRALANQMALLGRLDEAVALAQAAIALDPLRSGSHLTSPFLSPRSAATTRPRRRCARPSNWSRRPPRGMGSLRLFRYCAANPERRWNSRKRKPIRTGAPTH